MLIRLQLPTCVILLGAVQPCWAVKAQYEFDCHFRPLMNQLNTTRFYSTHPWSSKVKKLIRFYRTYITYIIIQHDLVDLDGQMRPGIQEMLSKSIDEDGQYQWWDVMKTKSFFLDISSVRHMTHTISTLVCLNYMLVLSLDSLETDRLDLRHIDVFTSVRLFFHGINKIGITHFLE